MRQYYGLPDDSPEFRAFWGLDADGNLEVRNVWGYGLQLLGNPPADPAMRIQFEGTPDNYEAITLGFDIARVRQLYDDLGEVLEYLPSDE